jgi:filamentous hemagglutinin
LDKVGYVFTELFGSKESQATVKVMIDVIKACVASPGCSGFMVGGMTAAWYNKIKPYVYKANEEESLKSDEFDLNSNNKKVHNAGDKEKEYSKQSDTYGTPDGDDFDPDDDDKDWKEWKVEDYDKAMLHNKHGKFYRDPKAVSENGNRLWWSKDRAGHGGSEWKLFEETAEGLKWYKDVDKYGNYITSKHKGPVGRDIPWEQLRGLK